MVPDGGHGPPQPTCRSCSCPEEARVARRSAFARLAVADGMSKATQWTKPRASDRRRSGRGPSRPRHALQRAEGHIVAVAAVLARDVASAARRCLSASMAGLSDATGVAGATDGSRPRRSRWAVRLDRRGLGRDARRIARQARRRSSRPPPTRRRGAGARSERGCGPGHDRIIVAPPARCRKRRPGRPSVTSSCGS